MKVRFGVPAAALALALVAGACGRSSSPSASPTSGGGTTASTAASKCSSEPLKATDLGVTADTITVGMPTWGGAPEQTQPVFFGAGAQAYGLQPNTTYYVASAPKVKGRGKATTYTFQLSSTWKQVISPVVTLASGQQAGGVPEQGNGGTPGPLSATSIDMPVPRRAQRTVTSDAPAS